MVIASTQHAIYRCRDAGKASFVIAIISSWFFLAACGALEREARQLSEQDITEIVELVDDVMPEQDIRLFEKKDALRRSIENISDKKMSDKLLFLSRSIHPNETPDYSYFSLIDLKNCGNNTKYIYQLEISYKLEIGEINCSVVDKKLQVYDEYCVPEMYSDIYSLNRDQQVSDKAATNIRRVIGIVKKQCKLI